MQHALQLVVVEIGGAAGDVTEHVLTLGALDNLKEIGKGTQRQDMLGHVTGSSTYFNDHKLQGMLHLKVLRSPHAHARIRRIDTAEAERSPGVRRIIGGADVPRNLNPLLSLINFGKDDEPTLAVDKVRYKGEPVIAVVADSPREAFEALAKVRVDYEPLPAVFDVEEALKAGAPVVNETYPKNTFTYYETYDHQKLRFGDVERGFASADHVIEQRYQMSPIEHAPTETNGSIAAPDTNGRYVVYTSTQALFFSVDTCAKILDVPSNTFHFIGGTVGGGFGGKVDTLTEPLAILGAMLTGRPVRYIFEREEEMQYGPPRGAERIYLKDGVMRDGRIVARKVRAYFDSGAYTRLSSYAAVKCAAQRAGGVPRAGVPRPGGHHLPPAAPPGSPRPPTARAPRPPAPHPPHPPTPPPVAPAPAPQPAAHGAIRFSSVFGSRRR